MKPLTLLPQIPTHQSRSPIHAIHTLPSIRISDSTKALCMHKKEELSMVQEEEQYSLLKSTSRKNSFIESPKIPNNSLSVSLKLSVSNSLLNVSTESSSQEPSQVFEWVSSRYTD